MKGGGKSSRVERKKGWYEKGKEKEGEGRYERTIIQWNWETGKRTDRSKWACDH